MRNLSTFILLLFLSLQGRSQQVEDLLDAYVNDNAGPYIQPLSELFMVNLHTGLHEWATIDSQLYIRVGGVASVSFPSSCQKVFQGVTPKTFDPQQMVEVPTIIGDINPITVDGINGTAYVFPGGYHLRSLPLAFPQVTVGGVFHTEFSARYLAFELDNEFGKISLLGLGFRHALNPYFKKLPVDISMGYYYHSFKDASYINSNFHQISACVGKSGRIWSASLMGAYQLGTSKIVYDYKDGDEMKTRELSIDNKQNIAVELSGSLKLAIFLVHAAIQYSGPVSAAAGVGIQF